MNPDYHPNSPHEPDGVTKATTEQIEAAKLLVAGRHDRQEIAHAVGCTVDEIEVWLMYSPAFRERVELEGWFLHQENIARMTLLFSDTADALHAQVHVDPIGVAGALRHLKLPAPPPNPRNAQQLLDEAARARAEVANRDERAQTVAAISPLSDQIMVDEVAEGLTEISRFEVTAARRRRPSKP